MRLPHLATAGLVAVTVASATSVRAQLSDLRPTKLRVSAPVAGHVGTYEVWTTNTGVSPTGGTTSSGLYLSTDATVTTADTLLTSWSVPSLRPTQSHIGSGSYTAPTTIRTGTCWIGAIVDRLNQVSEVIESNNVAAVATRCTGLPDLSISAFTTSPGLARGGDVDVSVRIKNGGTELAPLSTHGIYVSADSTIGTRDYLLRSWQFAKLQPGQTLGFAAKIPVPRNAPIRDGNCYIGAFADRTGQMRESSETNNTVSKRVLCGPFPEITRQPADKSICLGFLASGTVVMSVAANSASRFQWRKDRVNLPGKTSATLTLSTNIQPSDAGLYDCVVSNLLGSVTSSQARLTVGPCRVYRGGGARDEVVANVGDVNGDGYEDFGFGRPFFSASGSGIVIVSGKDQSLLAFPGNRDTQQWGASLAGGDLDDDGKGDVVFGAPAHRINSTIPRRPGAVFWLSGANLRATPRLLRGGTAGFGRLLATGRINARGGTDVVATDNDERTVVVFDGKSGGLIWKQDFPSKVGAIAVIGDINGDGHGDVLLGFPNHNNDNGRYEIRSGQRDKKLLRAKDGIGAELLGFSVAGIGDVNSDGVPDYATGSPGAPGGNVFMRSGADGRDIRKARGGTGRRFGFRVASAGGDLNGDGIPDLLVSDVALSGSGSVFVISGKDMRPIRSFRGTSREWGHSIASIESNGDSMPDLLVLDRGKHVLLYDALPKPNPPSFVPFGTTCKGEAGRLPRIGLGGKLPRVAKPFTVTLASAKPNTIALLKLALNRAALPLDALGAPGCVKLYSGSLITLGIGTNARGRADVTLPVPDVPGLAGKSILWQWIVLDEFNALGLVFSDGATMTIGEK